MDLLAPGAIFASDYRVVAPLSAGGMGSVFVVEQLSTGARRALKLMHPALVSSLKLRERFEQEARVGARIPSDHVVAVLAAGIDDASGMPWLVMELLEGEDLAAAAARRGAFSPPEVVELFEQLGHGLGAAHALGIVHRDIKPENVFLASPRRAGINYTLKILDFGIAKVAAEAKSTHTMSLGTPLWMAPEQARDSAHIGPATDVWALGLLAFWMLTGVPYWLAASAPTPVLDHLMRELLHEPLSAPTARAEALGRRGAVPPAFDAWFAGAVARDPAARFADATAAVSSLAAALAHAAPPAFAATEVARRPSAPSPTFVSTELATEVAPPFAPPVAVHPGVVRPAPPPRVSRPAWHYALALPVALGVGSVAMWLGVTALSSSAAVPPSAAPRDAATAALLRDAGDARARARDDADDSPAERGRRSAEALQKALGVQLRTVREACHTSPRADDVTVKLRITVSPAGQVQAASAQSTPAGQDALTRCVAAAARRMRFSGSRSTETATATLVFTR